MSEQRIEPLMRRIWSMPSPWTFQIKPIRELILKYMVPGDKPEGRWIDPFAGSNPFKLDLSNDLNPESPTTFHMDAVEFLEYLHDWDETTKARFDGALFDPPYTLHQTNQVYKGFGLRKPVSLTKDLIAPLIKQGGYVLCFGHNSGGMGINRGFELIEVLLVPHGGSHDDTIAVVERKK
jgi:hypothetical protein